MKISSLLNTQKYTELVVKYCERDFSTPGNDLILGRYFYRNGKLTPINSPVFNIDTDALKFEEDGVTLIAYVEPVFYDFEEMKNIFRKLTA